MHTKGDTHIPPKSDSNSPDAAGPGDKFDDEDFPAYSMGRAAEILGVTQAFLRSLDTAKLITPLRSGAVTAAIPATNSASPHARVN